MEIDECYRELGLAPGSSDAEVKEAWRRLAARWHPDRNTSPHALRNIQRINRALAEIRRWKAGSPAERDGPDDTPDPAPAHDHTVTITLEEACAGCSRELRGELLQDCDVCAGSGLQARPTTCGECGGSGRTRPHIWLAWLSTSAVCGVCAGEGTTRARCDRCDGTGQAPPLNYRCRVQVPPGVREGSVLDVTARVQQRGRRRELALRVRIALEPHPVFALQSDGTVTCELPVDGFAWMTERWTEVPTPRGVQQMRLRRGYLSYRIKGQGLHIPSSQTPADCIVTVVPLFPDEFNDAQQVLVDRLIASNSGSAGTASGKAMAAWKATMETWLARGDGPAR
jgi:DnaJ-class molecular chaperone